ncbi:hypothetical protein A1O1_02542 [Capronia coronata CBS 617.96]|uniref:Uncharacterized protein n=1 Tax=Capronia coronata CBS 617.96 TaxID=1182541 RepID=W9ZI20_9EURO|nr:uncharacterized protein A1O1_02542 [Capronia coronata CBS 617.96]EXJ94149.1 hypothetical protein A1O1_02542 [Capronia coronata CBS 617.96]
MREGYDGDDIYVMVEDEFQTIAQSYTAHLHHAEYKRLVKQAREAAPKALPEPTSPMSKETKNRLKSMTLQKKQKNTLQQVLGPTPTEIEEDTEVAEDKVVDLWSGTSLAPLMANTVQQKTSLIGMERMSSKTKAGMGFTRRQSGGDFIEDAVDDKDDEEDEDEDGLDITRKPRRTPPGESESMTDGFGLTSRVLSSELPTRRHDSSAQRGSEASVKKSAAASSSGLGREPAVLEDGMDELGLPMRRPRPTPRAARNGFLKRKAEEQDKQSRLEDVPMFII